MSPRHRSALALAAPILLLSLAACSQEPAKPAAATPAPAAAPPAPPPAVRVYVTNEQSGDLTVINGDTQAVMATAPLGKRPRGIQASPDGKSLYVALSGSPPAGPGVDPKTLPPPDRNADGIGEVDADTYKLKRIIHAGADPEQLAVSADGTRLYVANEDTETLSVVDVASGKVVAAVKVGEEPEGVTIRPDGKVVYVTSEGDGAVFAIDTETNKLIKRIPVGPRPRSIGFLPDGSRGYVSLENQGAIAVFDARAQKFLRLITLEGQGNTPKPRPMGIKVSAGRIDRLRDRRIVRPSLLHRSGEERADRIVRGRPAAVGPRADAGRQDGLHRERAVERRLAGRSRGEAGGEEDPGRQSSVGRRDH